MELLNPRPARPARLRPLRLALAALALLAVAARGLAAGAAPVPEYNAKAGYLLLFTRYVTWPEQAFGAPGDPVVIGILGENPFGDVLERTVRDLKSQGRPIAVRQVQTPEEAAACHVVFISRRQAAQEVEWLRQLRGRPVLTVTESGHGLDHGAVIMLSLDESLRGTRVTFSANLAVARAVGLGLSASMLASAREVVREQPAPGGGS